MWKSLLGIGACLSALVMGVSVSAAATATPELTNAAAVIGDQLQANVVGVLPVVALIIAALLGISLGIAWIVKLFRRYGKG